MMCIFNGTFHSSSAAAAGSELIETCPGRLIRPSLSTSTSNARLVCTSTKNSASSPRIAHRIRENILQISFPFPWCDRLCVSVFAKGGSSPSGSSTVFSSMVISRVEFEVRVYCLSMKRPSVCCPVASHLWRDGRTGSSDQGPQNLRTRVWRSLASNG